MAVWFVLLAGAVPRIGRTIRAPGPSAGLGRVARSFPPRRVGNVWAGLVRVAGGVAVDMEGRS